MFTEEHIECLNNNLSLMNSKPQKSLAKMDDSDDYRKRKNNTLNDWSNNPFERVNHSTNFEDYACSSDDYHYTTPEDKSNGLVVSKQNQNTNKDSLSNSFNKICVKPSKFESTVTPIVSTHLSDPKDHSFVESCLSAGNSSADVTPSGTPQNSPYSLRKIMENKKLSNNNKTKLSTNPKRWFYTGFFNSDIKTDINDKPINPLPKNPSFKNLCVSNFDINAVGPTSW